MGQQQEQGRKQEEEEEKQEQEQAKGLRPPAPKRKFERYKNPFFNFQTFRF